MSVQPISKRAVQTRMMSSLPQTSRSAEASSMPLELLAMQV